MERKNKSALFKLSIEKSKPLNHEDFFAPNILIAILALSFAGYPPKAYCQGIPECGPLTDPALGYNPNLELDLCCGLSYDASVCYTMDGLVQTWGYPDSFLFYSILIDTVLVAPPGPEFFSSFDSLAYLLTYYAGLNGVSANFQFDSATNSICAINPTSTAFGGLTICIPYNGPPDFHAPCYIYSIYPEISDGCPISMPNFDALFDPDGFTLPDTTLIDGDGFELSTDDIINSEGPLLDPNEAPYTGPSMEEIGYLLYATVQSGALEYGIGCFNFNCIDLNAMADAIAEGEFADSLTALAGAHPEILDSLGLSNENELADFFSDEANIAIDDLLGEYGNFTGFINSYMGWNIPDQDTTCNETYYTPDEMRNLEERAKKPGNHKNSLDEFLRVLMQNDGPSIDADQDYFSQEIAGLGLDGPGAALPSPSGLKMIDQVNAGVHLYNGSQSTTIPLYTLSANDISIPVSLSSSSNGLKVNDLGSMARPAVGDQCRLDDFKSCKWPPG